MIKIEFHTPEVSLQNLARRYWARNAQGSWEETVEALSIAMGIPKSQIPKIVKNAASAYLESLVCSTCNKPTLLTSRADFVNLRSHGKFLSRTEIAYREKELNYTCQVCIELKRNAELQFQKEQEQQKRNKINSVLDDISQRKFDFSKISFLDAVYCHVIRQASGIGSYSNKETIFPSKLFIAYTLERKTEIFKRLFENGILQISKNSPPTAFDIGEKGVTYEPSKVAWAFALDANNFSDEIVTEIIDGTLEIPDIESLCTLWEQVAQHECEVYFYEVCERWGHASWSLTNDKQEAMIYALKNYSIPRVWNMMYKEAQNLGAQANAGTFNRRHIENMFSGNLRRRSDKWFANSWDVHPWKRRTFEKECYLTSIVFDHLFGGGDRDWEGISFSNLARRATEVVQSLPKN